jgi:hypothetical protein
MRHGERGVWTDRRPSIPIDSARRCSDRRGRGHGGPCPGIEEDKRLSVKEKGGEGEGRGVRRHERERRERGVDGRSGG